MIYKIYQNFRTFKDCWNKLISIDNLLVQKSYDQAE